MVSVPLAISNKQYSPFQCIVFQTSDKTRYNWFLFCYHCYYNNNHKPAWYIYIQIFMYYRIELTDRTQYISYSIDNITYKDILFFWQPKAWIRYKYVQKCMNTKLKTCYIKLIVTKSIWQIRYFKATSHVQARDHLLFLWERANVAPLQSRNYRTNQHHILNDWLPR